MSTEAFLDTRFAALPRLIREATNPSIVHADIRRFMDELLQADPTLFDGALQFMSREGHGFVLLRRSGGPLRHPRTWSRWPLKRLFATRRPSIITNPETAQQALAVPFGLAGERHVIVAPLRISELDAAQQTFLGALQSLSVSAAAAAPAGERIPRFLWFGRDLALAERVELMLRRRGWPLSAAPTFGHALLMLEQDQVDVVILESRSLKDQLSSLRTLRHAAKIGDAPIVYFVENVQVDAEIQTLVDCVLPVDASDGEILRALKATAAQVSSMRSRALRASVERMDGRLRTCGDFAELAETCARAALTLGADAVSVMLADSAGNVYPSHLPFQTILGDHWPTPFVTGETITAARADDAFFEHAFDDEQYAKQLRELHPISAAAFPIGNGPQIFGSLLVFSTQQQLFQPEFDAFIDLCERTGHAALLLREPRTSKAPWQHAMVAQAVLDVFEGQNARASICVRSNENAAAIVIVEREDSSLAGMLAERLLLEHRSDLSAFLAQVKGDVRGMLVAVVNQAHELRFACEGLPLPVRVPLSGPVPATRYAQACQSGAIQLDAQCATLLYSREFAMQIPTGDLVGAVQRGLRNSRATLARSLPGLSTNARKIAFACITMRSSDVDSPRPPALV